MDDDFSDDIPHAGDPAWRQSEPTAVKTDDDWDADSWREGVGEGLAVAWRLIDDRRPHRPGKTRVTLRLDEDVLRWFKKRGPGYQTCMNAALRAFMAASRKAKWGISDPG